MAISYSFITYINHVTAQFTMEMNAGNNGIYFFILKQHVSMPRKIIFAHQISRFEALNIPCYYAYALKSELNDEIIEYHL